MSRPLKPSATSVLALDTGAAATPARLAAGAIGESTSSAAMARLNAAVSELKALSIQPLLQGAVNALNAGHADEGARLAMKALEVDERSGFGWYLLALAREMSGDFASSITCYEAALRLLPDHAEIANNLGRLAFRLGQTELAEKLFRAFLQRFPNHHEGANNLACTLRTQMRFDEAVEVLRAAIMENAGHADLWNTLGTIMAEQGDSENAAVFFDEALRLAPDFAKAHYNRGNMSLALGDPVHALECCETALSKKITEDERQMMLLARSTIKINLGRVGEGWDDYEARLSPHFADVTVFAVDRPRWTPGDDLAGKRLLVIGEQGLGDEILFANVLSDILDALGPDGRLILAVEGRLVPLFQRSFPTAEVGPHRTVKADGRSHRFVPFLEGRMGEVDLYTPMGSLLRQYRRTVEAFPDRVGFLAADPDRVAYWKDQLKAAPPGRKVGLLWKSNIINGGRHRFFSPFEQWAPVLRAPGATMVNLQYGDCAPELEQARRDFGVDIWSPPGIDLKQDLDDVAALCCALDLVVGFSNATLNIAAACGAPTWLITAPAAWTRLGTDRYPWYPQIRSFVPPGFGEWSKVMSEVASALSEPA